MNTLPNDILKIILTDVSLDDGCTFIKMTKINKHWYKLIYELINKHSESQITECFCKGNLIGIIYHLQKVFKDDPNIKFKNKFGYIYYLMQLTKYLKYANLIKFYMDISLDVKYTNEYDDLINMSIENDDPIIIETLLKHDYFKNNIFRATVNILHNKKKINSIKNITIQKKQKYFGQTVDDLTYAEECLIYKNDVSFIRTLYACKTDDAIEKCVVLFKKYNYLIFSKGDLKNLYQNHPEKCFAFIKILLENDCISVENTCLKIQDYDINIFDIIGRILNDKLEINKYLNLFKKHNLLNIDQYNKIVNDRFIPSYKRCRVVKWFTKNCIDKMKLIYSDEELSYFLDEDVYENRFHRDNLKIFLIDEIYEANKEKINNYIMVKNINNVIDFAKMNMFGKIISCLIKQTLAKKSEIIQNLAINIYFILDHKKRYKYIYFTHLYLDMCEDLLFITESDISIIFKYNSFFIIKKLIDKNYDKNIILKYIHVLDEETRNNVMKLINYK